VVVEGIPAFPPRPHPAQLALGDCFASHHLDELLLFKGDARADIGSALAN